jgi:hypothetical protein
VKKQSYNIGNRSGRISETNEEEETPKIIGLENLMPELMKRDMLDKQFWT